MGDTVTMKRAKQWYRRYKREETEVAPASFKRWVRKSPFLFKDKKLSEKLELILLK